MTFKLSDLYLRIRAEIDEEANRLIISPAVLTILTSTEGARFTSKATILPESAEGYKHVGVLFGDVNVYCSGDHEADRELFSEFIVAQENDNS